MKELREILRDRRTTITLVAMPLLIYPLLGVTMQKLLIAELTSQPKVEYHVALTSEKDVTRFRKLYGRGHVLVAQREGRTLSPDQVPAGTLDDPILQLLAPKGRDGAIDVVEVVREGDADVGIQFYAAEEGRSPKCNVVFRGDSVNSRAVRRFIEDRFRAVNEDFAKETLAKQQPAAVMPILVESLAIPKQPGTTDTPFSLAILIPLILILMTVTGAVYPAIDLTAGERERGTLEALVAAPVPRHELLFAKYVAVLTVAMLTAVANLLSMVVTAYASGLEGLLFGTAGLSIRVIASTLGLLFVFAAFFVLIPGLPLVQVMLMAQVINALLLPFVLVFVMLLASDKKLMGPLVSGRLLQVVGWTGTGLLVLLSLMLAWSSLFVST